MSISGSGIIGWFALAGLSIVTHAYAVVSINYVPVGNAGNAVDRSGYGSVSYAYKIGKYEVTTAQYTEFLNTKGTSDSYGLYNSAYMPDYTGIIRSGNSGSYNYRVTGTSANKPVKALQQKLWVNFGSGRSPSV
jgi:hypothetical protein